MSAKKANRLALAAELGLVRREDLKAMEDRALAAEEVVACATSLLYAAPELRDIHGRRLAEAVTAYEIAKRAAMRALDALDRQP